MIPTDESRNHAQLPIYSVSELNQKIKQLLEASFPFVWVSGEISNFKIPASGHLYFTLKDSHSQISAVMFRTQAGSLKFRPSDGQSVVGLGRLSLYQPRGSYQIIFEYIEPKGIGSLQIAFEKLKRTLADEGLFDARHKTMLPLVPKKISIVTSPTGAAIRDFIKVAQRRFPNLPLEVVPVSVQGDRAPGEICQAIGFLNELATTDIIVLARGGGSIEDLWAFNDERVARAIFASTIPIVSAVGHETDYTIADFVADLRAPTPSAAAEIVVPSKQALQNQLQIINKTLYKEAFNHLKNKSKNVYELSGRLVHPRRRLQDSRIRLDDYSIRLLGSISKTLAQNRERACMRHHILLQGSPLNTVTGMQTRLVAWQRALNTEISRTIRAAHHSVATHVAMVAALSPLAIVQRGYSITRTLPGQSIVRRAESVKMGQHLEILLAHGKLTVSVTDTMIERNH